MLTVFGRFSQILVKLLRIEKSTSLKYLGVVILNLKESKDENVEPVILRGNVDLYLSARSESVIKTNQWICGFSPHLVAILLIVIRTLECNSQIYTAWSGRKTGVRV